MDMTAKFDPKALAKKHLRQAREAAFGTVLREKKGAPYASMAGAPSVSYALIATAFDGSPILRISRLAVHTQNILADDRVSFMIEERKGGNRLNDPRLTLWGRAKITTDESDARRYLSRHPGAQRATDFGDFAYYRVQLEGARLVEGRSERRGAAQALVGQPGSLFRRAVSRQAAGHRPPGAGR